MKRVFLDTETTGLAPGQIAQLSLIIDEDGKDIECKNYFFEIDYITPDAEAICGKGVDFYKEASGGKRFKDYMEELQEIFKDAVLIAHNLQFDENFISTEFWRQNIIFKPHDRFCTMLYFKNICKILGKTGRVKNPKLSEVVDFYNIDKNKVGVYCTQLFGLTMPEDYHDARFDTTAMFVVYKVYSDITQGTDNWKKVFVKE